MGTTPPAIWRVRATLRRSRALRRSAVAFRHRGLEPDDVFIASYPRSGNTWIRFVLADLATGEQADFETVDRIIPNVGHHEGASPIAGGARLIKTHEAYRREYRRAVYVVRDVRDVLASWYRVTRPDPDDLSALDAFVADFVTERASPYGAWRAHVSSWLEAAQNEGGEILIERFESMKEDPAATVRRVAGFARIPVDDTRLEAALRRNNPDAMRRLEREATDYLRDAFGYMSLGVRRGTVGGWRELLSQRHLRILEPALVLNRELGYSDS